MGIFVFIFDALALHRDAHCTVSFYCRTKHNAVRCVGGGVRRSFIAHWPPIPIPGFERCVCSLPHAAEKEKAGSSIGAWLVGRVVISGVTRARKEEQWFVVGSYSLKIGGT